MVVSVPQKLRISSKYFCILANRAGEGGQITDNPSVVSAGHVEYFYNQKIQVGNEVNKHVEVKMAFVRWFQEHSCRSQ